MSSICQGVVLSITPYKESSAMVHLLSKEYGLLRFVLQGFYKPTSKMQSLGIPFSQVEYRTDYKENRLLKAYGGQLLESYADVRSDYDWLLMMSLVSELIVDHFDNDYKEELYRQMVDNLKGLDLKKILKLLVRIIAMAGLHPYLLGCVVCDDHRINAFSIEEGGYTCQLHSKSKDSYDYLVLLGQLFNEKEIGDSSPELYMQTLKSMVLYLEYHSNIKNNTIQLL